MSQVDSTRFTPKTRVGFFGGISIPVGDFASVSGTDASAAKTGMSFGASVLRPLSRHFHAGANTLVAFHPFDKDAVQDNKRDSLSRYEIDGGGWLLLTVMGELGAGGAVSRAIELYARLSAGGMLVRRPEIIEDNITRSGSGRQTNNADVALAPVYGVRAGVVLYDCFELSVRYLSARPKYQVTSHIQHGLTTTDSFTRTVIQPTSMIQLLFGYVLP